MMIFPDFNTIQSLTRGKCIYIVLWALLLSLFMQHGAMGQEKTDDMTFLYQIDVISALTDVIVTDKDGNYVTDLTKDDFVILVDGKQVKVDSCQLIIHDEETARQAGVVIPPPEKKGYRPKAPSRQFFLFFDLYNTRASRVNLIKKAAERFIREYIREEDHLLLAQFTPMGKVEILLPPSSSREEAIQELDKISGGTAFHPEFIEQDLMNDMNDPDIPMAHTVNTVTMLATEVFFRNRLTVDALRIFINAVRHFPGRKNVLYFSEGIERKAGERYIALVENLLPRKSNLVYINNLAGAAQGQETGDASANLGEVLAMDVSGLNQLRSRLYDAIHLMDDLIESANVSQIVLYTVDLAGLLPADDMYLTSNFGVWGGTSLLGQIRYGYEEVFKYMADESGGRYSLRNQDYDRILRDIYADTNIYYMLSYTPVDVKRDSTPHDIKVKVTRPGLSVRGRNKIRYRSMKEEVEARITGALLLPDAFQNEGIRIGVDYFYETENLAGLTIAAGLPADECIFPQLDGNLTGRLDFHGIIFDSKGKIVRTFDHTGRMRLEKMPDRLLADIYCVMRKNLELKPGEYSLSIALRSKESHEVSGISEKMVIPESPINDIAMSTIYLYGGPVEKVRWDVSAETDDEVASNELSFDIPGLADPFLRNLFSYGEYLTAYIRILYPSIVTPEMSEDKIVAFEIIKQDEAEEGYPAKIENYRIIHSTNPKELIYVADIDVRSLTNGAYILKAIYLGNKERPGREKPFIIRLMRP